MKFRLNITAPNVSLFFIGLMLTLPFLLPIMTLPITTFYKEWLTAALALFALIPLIRQTAWPTYQVPVIIWLPIGMLGVMGIQLVLLDIAYWQHYLLVAQYLVLAALVMLLGGMLKQSVGLQKAIKWVAGSLLVAGLLSCIIIALDMSNINLNNWVVASVSGAIANVGQSNHLCSLLAMALASLIYFYHQQSIKSTWFWLFALIMLAGLALTASRSAWVFIAFITIGVWSLNRAHRKSTLASSDNTQANVNSSTMHRKRLKSLFILPVLFYAVQVGLPYMPTAKPVNTTNQRLVELAQKKDSPRLQIYQASWYTYAAHPLLGTGFGQMAWDDLTHADRVPSFQGTNNHAHNIVLQLLAETGVLGTTIFLVAGIAFYARVRHAQITPERWLLWISLLILSTHALLEQPLWYMHYFVLFSLLLGLGDTQAQSIARIRPQLAITMLAMFWAASLVQTLHDYRVIEYWHGHHKTQKFDHNSFDQMNQAFRPIRQFSPFAHYADNQLLLRLPANRDNLADKLDITERILSAYVSPALSYNYATLMALDGRLDEAKLYLNKVHMRYPMGIDAYWENTVKTTLSGEPTLFPLVKHIEFLRDGYVPDDEVPIINYEQFKKPANTTLPESVRG